MVSAAWTATRDREKSYGDETQEVPLAACTVGSIPTRDHFFGAEVCMRLLVCGGRGYNDLARGRAVLDRFHAKHPVSILIQGGANGADFMAAQWALANGIHCAEVAALWRAYGKAAGPKRNAAMLSLAPDAVIAFPGGAGTANMVAQAEAAGVKVWRIDQPTSATPRPPPTA